MINDRNKTALTKDVTAAAIAYLDERGCKPLETEIWVCNDPCWIADVAAVLSPTQTEMIMLRLLKHKPKQYGTPKYDAWHDAMLSLTRLMTVIVEVKTTRADFRGDKKWMRPIPSDLAYLAIPRDIVRVDEFPAGWGILEFHDGVLRCLRPPTPRISSVEERLHTILQIAIRRDNCTRYERMRSFQREHRSMDNEYVSRTRISHAVRAVKAIVEGRHGSVQGALEYHSIKGLAAGFVEELESLWAKVPA